MLHCGMREKWLNNLDQNTAVIVPTRSLANMLNEQVAQNHIEQGQTVWEAPNIFVWKDYLKQLWHANRQLLHDECGRHQLISPQQSALLWTQIVEASRREESELTLLNVQQTVRAIQRSWSLLHDWQVSLPSLAQDHVADTEQFLAWVADYQTLLEKRSLLDESLLLSTLCNSNRELNFPYSSLLWYAYDLITSAQHKVNRLAENQGIEVVQKQAAEQMNQHRYAVYSDSKSELRQSLMAARRLLENEPDCTVNIVIHDLQERQAQVQETARDVFYSSASPLQVQQNSTAYRFSLGQTLADWAAIETALSVIALLKNRITSVDLSFLLRNQFLSVSTELRTQCRLFDRWLKRQRMRSVLFDQLPQLYEQCLESLSPSGSDLKSDPNALQLLETLNALVLSRQSVVQRLDEAKAHNNFAALAFTGWVDIFNEWLEAWGWSTKAAGDELNTVQHQLLKRWQSLLEEYAGLSAVQRQVGIKRAIDLLQQMARDAMFLPKAVASPVLISSILEAAGRPADYCFLLGMNDAFPPAPKNDVFIPQRLLAEAGHPDMSADSSFQQAQLVIHHLLSSCADNTVSYAQQSDLDREISHQASPLFRHHFSENDNEAYQHALHVHEPVELQHYQDTRGPAWADAERAKGGSKIFENQSHCAFKAFVTHQLGYQGEEEAEFGLDHLDRGSVVHYLLEQVWARLQTQEQLKKASDQVLNKLIEDVIDLAWQDPRLNLSADKQTLLQHERPRLIALINDWLALEKTRPEHFSVIEREEERFGVIAGIEFKYIIDRLDMTDDGRTFIIDYKTGAVARKDWLNETFRSPQMPLYAVALDAAKQKPVSGIAYAKVRQHEHSFVELSEAGVFRKASKKTAKDAELWIENRQHWEPNLKQLANDFLAGEASVVPADEAVCAYCDLQSVCRISQLRQVAVSEEKQ